VSRGGTADARVVLVLTRVAGHLAEGAAGTKEGAATVLAPHTLFLGDGVLAPHALAGLAEAVERPNAKQTATDHLHHRDINRNIHRIYQARIRINREVALRRELHGAGKDYVGHIKHHHNLEGDLGPCALAGLTEPGKGHTGHDLGHGNRGTPAGTAQGGVADPEGKAVAKAILPLSGGGLDA